VVVEGVVERVVVVEGVVGVGVVGAVAAALRDPLRLTLRLKGLPNSSLSCEDPNSVRFGLTYLVLLPFSLEAGL
jgi:hypothetical protein